MHLYIFLCTFVIRKADMKNLKTFTELPKNWIIVTGTNTQPIGFVFISNNKSRFGTERELALLKIN